jgi:hypothetical protein
VGHDCVQYAGVTVVVGWKETPTEVRGEAGYFFFRFFVLSLKGPLTASSTASLASRATMGFLFGGNARGWPIFQSVLLLFDPLAFFFALFATHLECHRQKLFTSLAILARFLPESKLGGLFQNHVHRGSEG